MLPTSAGVEPTTSWSPVERRIQLSHRGQPKKLDFNHLSAVLHEMDDPGGPGSVRKCHGVALADLGDTEGFGRDGEENQLYAFWLADGVYKRKKGYPRRVVAEIRRAQ